MKCFKALYIKLTFQNIVIALYLLCYEYRIALCYCVKPVYAATSFKQSSVLNGHFFPVLSYTISYELNLF